MLPQLTVFTPQTFTKDSKRHGRSSRKRNDRQQKSTWCKKRKEREEQLWLPETVRHFKRGSPSSPITISSEEEDFDLPELGSDGDKNVSHTATTHCKVKSCAMETDDIHKGKDRHFMDTLSSLSLQNSENEQSQSVKTEIRSHPKLQQRKDRISSEIQAGSSPVHVETIIAPSFDIENQSVDRRADKQVKNGRVKFLLGHPALQTEVNSLNNRFSHLQVSMIECASEDQGDSIFFSQILELLENFSHTHKPPSALVENVIRCGLLDVQHEELAFRSYWSVLAIWHHYPDLVLLDWTALQTAGDVLKKGLQARSAHFAKKSVNTSECNNNTRTESNSKEPTFHQAALFLQLMLQGLRINLKNCKLPDQSSVRKSLAFKSLSVEQTATFRHIIHWLECCLVTTEHLDSQSVSTDTDIKQKTKDSQCDKDRNRLVLGHQEVCPWLLESLQNLLSLIVFVSEDRHATARKLSSDLVRTYIYLPSMQAKKQLLQTLSSPLLCFYLVCLVLENHCSNAIRMNSRFPESLNELTNCYFYASPPKSPVTPPPSPSDEDDNMEEGSTHHQYSAQSCEELAMLIFFVTKSFIACRQSKLQTSCLINCFVIIQLCVCVCCACEGRHESIYGPCVRHSL